MFWLHIWKCNVLASPWSSALHSHQFLYLWFPCSPSVHKTLPFLPPLAQSHASDCPFLHSWFLEPKPQEHTSLLNSNPPSVCMLLYSLLPSSIFPTLHLSQIPKSLQLPIIFWFFLQIACPPWSFAFFTKDIAAFFIAWDATVWAVGSLSNWVSKKQKTAGLPDV